MNKAHILCSSRLMELRWTPWPDLTNTRLLSPGIIWFWSQANIPWLDFVIDSARAVKVSQSPGPRTRAGACTRWPSVGIWHTKQCRFSGGIRGLISGTDAWIYIIFQIIFGMMECPSTFSASPYMLELLPPELFGSKLSSTKLTHHDDLVTDVPGDSSAKNDWYF